MTTLCTLFDHNYLDKGLAMYESLEKVCDEFELYVLAMSDKCYEILIDLNYPHLKPFKLSDFETEELLAAKANRSFGKYCFTCSSNLIKFVLDKYSPEDCTYIDSDLIFYEDPRILIDEMYSAGKSVLITPHRYIKKEEKRRSKEVGKYCIEFNTFKNDRKGRQLLEVWRNQCLLSCNTIKGLCWGDQRYLNDWAELYDCVHVVKNVGAGVAPWNINDYKLVTEKDEHYELRYRHKINCKLVFYHFQGIMYKSKKLIRLCVLEHLFTDTNLVHRIYKPYLQRLDNIKDMLQAKYDVNTLILAHPEYYNGDRLPFWKMFNISDIDIYLKVIVRRLYYGDKDYINL